MRRDKLGNVYLTNLAPKPGYRLITKTPIDNRLRFPESERIPPSTLIRDNRKLFSLLLLAIIQVESGFDPYAVSSKGAKGLMQLMPSVCRHYGVKNPFDIGQNLRAGSAYFQEMLRRFEDVTLALAAYNAGPQQVEKYGGIPPFEETRQYIRRVIFYFNTYRQ